MKTFSIKEAFRKGWDLWSKHKALMTFVAIVTLIMGVGRNNDMQHGPYSPSLYVFIIIFILLSILIKIGLVKLFLKVVDGQHTSWKEIFKHTELFFVYLGTSLLFGLGIAAGLVLLIIPGIYVLFTYMFAPIIVIDQKISIRNAFKKSKEMTKGVKWKLLGFLLVLGLANILGALVLFVGLLVSIPVTSLAYMSVYRKLSA